MKVPAWVTFAAIGPGVVLCLCARCEGGERLEDVRQEVERGMGRFARWHARCADRAEIARDLRRARARRAEERPPQTFVVRSKA